MRATNWCVAIFVAGCGANAPEPPPPRLLEVPLVPRTFHLPNGLTAILVPDANADLASVLVRYQVDAIDDPVGQEGAAHLAAHVSYAPVRTGRFTLWDELDAISTWINTTAGDNYTDFTEQCQPEQLRDVLRLEARRLSAGCAGLTDAWFDWLRTQVADESRVNNTRVTNRDVNHALYPPSDPYYRAHDASPERIASLTREATCAFIDRHYGPQTATVVVSGPIDPRAFEAML